MDDLQTVLPMILNQRGLVPPRMRASSSPSAGSTAPAAAQTFGGSPNDERSGSGMSSGPRSAMGVWGWDARGAERSRRASGLLERSFS